MTNDIRSYRVDELKSVCKELGQPDYRAKQLYEWFHVHKVDSYDDMTNLPKSLRQLLTERYPLHASKVFDKQESSDGTRKYVIELSDGAKVETVGLPSVNATNAKGNATTRLTACISSQVGCPMACRFCATGKEGLTRNLEAAEIIEQVKTVQNDFETKVTNIVVMGQGEPFLNFDETLKALRILNSSDGYNIGARHITVSTCGIIDGIERFSTIPEQFTLALSLHAALQEKRDMLMPKVSGQPIDKLKRSLERYIRKTNRRVTFEYLMIREVNDTDADLKALLAFCEGLICHVNLLPVNPIDDSPFQPSKLATVEKWIKSLEQHHVETTFRKSRGSDIAGACGQLKNKISRR